MSIINPGSISTTRASLQPQISAEFNRSSSSSTQSNPLKQPMLSANCANRLAAVKILPGNFMDPVSPAVVTGYDLSSNGKEVVKNLSAEVTCRSEQGIRGSSDQAIQLKNMGREVSVTFALNDEPYSLLADNVVKMSKADIPVRLVAGDKATRGSGRENGNVIMQKILSMIQSRILDGQYDHSSLIKLKLKVCYHDGSELQYMVEKIRLTREFGCELDEISIQLQSLESLEKSFDSITRSLGALNQEEVPVVCYAIVFANDDAYEKAPQRIKNMAGHGFHDQEHYLRKLKSIVDRFSDASIRLSFFGFSKLHWRLKAALLNECYSALH